MGFIGTFACAVQLESNDNGYNEQHRPVLSMFFITEIACISTESCDSNTLTENSPEIKLENDISSSSDTTKEHDGLTKFDVLLSSHNDVTIDDVSTATQTSDGDISYGLRPKDHQPDLAELTSSLASLSKVAERITEKFEKVNPFFSCP